LLIPLFIPLAIPLIIPGAAPPNPNEDPLNEDPLAPPLTAWCWQCCASMSCPAENDPSPENDPLVDPSAENDPLVDPSPENDPLVDPSTGRTTAASRSPPSFAGEAILAALHWLQEVRFGQLTLEQSVHTHDPGGCALGWLHFLQTVRLGQLIFAHEGHTQDPSG
jgi:hypothetical protein